MNRAICKIIEQEEAKGKVNIVACKTCFETALFGEEVKEEKPYNALVRIRNDETAKNRVRQLLDYLIGVEGAVLPANCIHWQTIDQLS
jgi:putative ATP-dependent endonuclease of OLD family